MHIGHFFVISKVYFVVNEHFENLQSSNLKKFIPFNFQHLFHAQSKLQHIMPPLKPSNFKYKLNFLIICLYQMYNLTLLSLTFYIVKFAKCDLII